jgi:hypothetical protein
MASVVGKTRPLFSLSRSLARPGLFSTSTPRLEEPAWRTEPTKMTSSEAFTETMVAHGVNNMFGIVGSAFMDALDIFPAAGIRSGDVQHRFPLILDLQVYLRAA